MLTFKTPAGKEIQIIPDNRGAYKIQFATGGELHSTIQGIFTSEREAIKAVMLFLNRKENAKTK